MKFDSQISGAILRDEVGRFLLVQEKQEKVHGLWNIPAGYVDTGETPSQTAVRETKEEVGLNIELASEKPLFVFVNELKRKQYFAFLGKVVSGQLQIQEAELLDAGWRTFDEIRALSDAGKIREPWIMEALIVAEAA